jgi:hypothetical protein
MRVAAGLVMVGDCDRSPADALTASGANALARPKSKTLTVPFWPELDVCGLEIAMDDPLLVGRFKRLGNLTRDRQRLVDRNQSLRDPIGERRSLDQLQDECANAIQFFNTVDAADVVMVQRGEHLGFAQTVDVPRLSDNQPPQRVRGNASPWG